MWKTLSGERWVDTLEEFPGADVGWVLGLGSDLCEVERVRGVWERQGERFLTHAFTPAEAAYCLAMRDPAPFLAVRFAAKEAVAKAFGTGIGAELGWRSIEVVKGPNGEPGVRFDPGGRALCRVRGVVGVRLTLSHTATLALAVAVLVGRGPSVPLAAGSGGRNE